MGDFKLKMAELLEVENVELSDRFESFECWDSLTLLSIIAMADETYKVELTDKDVLDSMTIGGLEELIKSKMKLKSNT